MAVTLVVVLGSVMYIAPHLCLPVENLPCASFLK